MKILSKKKYLDLENYKKENTYLKHQIKELQKDIDKNDAILENIYLQLDEIQKNLKSTVAKNKVRQKIVNIMNGIGGKKIKVTLKGETINLTNIDSYDK